MNPSETFKHFSIFYFGPSPCPCCTRDLPCIPTIHIFTQFYCLLFFLLICFTHLVLVYFTPPVLSSSVSEVGLIAVNVGTRGRPPMKQKAPGSSTLQSSTSPSSAGLPSSQSCPHLTWLQEANQNSDILQNSQSRQPGDRWIKARGQLAQILGRYVSR